MKVGGYNNYNSMMTNTLASTKKSQNAQQVQNQNQIKAQLQAQKNSTNQNNQNMINANKQQQQMNTQVASMQASSMNGMLNILV